jgi:hypothetical protein
MRENKFLNAIFPVAGGSAGATIESVNQVKQSSFTVIECFQGVDAAFLVQTAISAIMGAIIGFTIYRGLNALFPKKNKK